MLDAVLPWLKLGGLIVYIVVVFRAARQLTTNKIPREYRKPLLYIIAFGGTAATAMLYVAIEPFVAETVAVGVGVIIFASLLACMFAIFMTV